MTIKILQLNINSDNYWNKLISFLTSHNFDLLLLQEITGKDTITGNINSKRDCFEELQKIFAEKYTGELSISQRYTSSPNSYMGNAIFYKNTFQLREKKIITFHSHKEPFPTDAKSYEDIGRTMLHLKLDIDGKIVSFLNAHFAWAHTPKEEHHQTEQGKKLIEYLESVPHPFILSGDFNLDPQQPTIQKINQLARNLTNENKITNTLNPRTHRAHELFPSGVAVDYIYVTADIKVNNFSIVEEDISDHFGLIAELEI